MRRAHTSWFVVAVSGLLSACSAFEGTPLPEGEFESGGTQSSAGDGAGGQTTTGSAGTSAADGGSGETAAGGSQCHRRQWCVHSRLRLLADGTQHGRSVRGLRGARQSIPRLRLPGTARAQHGGGGLRQPAGSVRQRDGHGPCRVQRRYLHSERHGPERMPGVALGSRDHRPVHPVHVRRGPPTYRNLHRNLLPRRTATTST